jgi:hypothetical protein
VKAGRFQQAVLFEQADPVFPPPGQGSHHILGQVPGVEHHHPEGHFVPDGLFDQLNRQRDFRPTRFMSRPTGGILEQHRVDLCMEAIAPLGIGRDLEVGTMLRPTGFPLGQFLIAAIQAQAQGKAHRAADIQARDRVMG